MSCSNPIDLSSPNETKSMFSSAAKVTSAAAAAPRTVMTDSTYSSASSDLFAQSDGDEKEMSGVPATASPRKEAPRVNLSSSSGGESVYTDVLQFIPIPRKHKPIRRYCTQSKNPRQLITLSHQETVKNVYKEQGITIYSSDDHNGWNKENSAAPQSNSLPDKLSKNDDELKSDHDEELSEVDEDDELSKVDDHDEDHDELPPLLQELARIMASRPTQSYSKWDFVYIENQASRALKKFINDTKKRCSSLRNNPMRLLVGDPHTKAFRAYRDQVHNDQTMKDQLEINDDESTLDYEDEACDDEEAGDDFVDDDDDDDDNGSHAKSSDDDHLGHDGLTPVLKELAHILEARPKGDRILWNWDHIDANASDSLKQYLKRRKQKFPTFRRRPLADIVGRHNSEAFTKYRQRLPKKSHGNHQSPRENSSGQSHAGRIRTIEKQQDREDEPDLIEPLTATKDESKRNAEKLLTYSSPPEKKRRHRLVNEQIELATLLATAKSRGQGWAFVETKASTRLKTFIRDKAKDPQYMAAPLQCLVQNSHLPIFYKYVVKAERAFEDGWEEHVSDDEASTEKCSQRDQYAPSPKSRKLGQLFALERKHRLEALLSNVRSDLRTYEMQELTIWNKFLDDEE